MFLATVGTGHASMSLVQSFNAGFHAAQWRMDKKSSDVCKVSQALVGMLHLSRNCYGRRRIYNCRNDSSKYHLTVFTQTQTDGAGTHAECLLLTSLARKYVKGDMERNHLPISQANSSGWDLQWWAQLDFKQSLWASPQARQLSAH